MNKITIYGIVDAMTGNVGYVGITKDLRRRKYQHLNSRGNTAKDVWMRGLDYQVIFVVLAETDTAHQHSLEQEWIAKIKSLGGTLHNSTIGGAGTQCCYPNASAKLRMSLAKLGHQLTPQHKEKLKGLATGNQHAKGYKHTPEALQKIADANRGKKKALGYHHTEEARAKIGAASRGKINSPETIEKMKLTHALLSDKKSADMKRIWAERKATKESVCV